MCFVLFCLFQFCSAHTLQEVYIDLFGESIVFLGSTKWMNCWSFSVQNAKHKSNLLLFLHRINFYRRDRVGTSVKNPPVMWLWSFTKTLPITWQRWETHLTHTVIIIIIINTTPAKWYCNMCNPIVTHEIITLAIKFMVVLRVLGTRNTIYILYNFFYCYFYMYLSLTMC